MKILIVSDFRIRKFKILKKIVKILAGCLNRFDSFRGERSEVENMLKLRKHGFIDKVYRHMVKSVTKFIYLNVLLLSITIRLEFREKKIILSMIEWRIWGGPK